VHRKLWSRVTTGQKSIGHWGRLVSQGGRAWNGNSRTLYSLDGFVWDGVFLGLPIWDGGLFGTPRKGWWLR
jgi:hypothetical protein